MSVVRLTQPTICTRTDQLALAQATPQTMQAALLCTPALEHYAVPLELLSTQTVEIGSLQPKTGTHIHHRTIP